MPLGSDNVMAKRDCRMLWRYWQGNIVFDTGKKSSWEILMSVGKAVWQVVRKLYAKYPVL